MKMSTHMDSKSVVNRKARHDYEISEEYEAGIVLFGWEVKSIRQGATNLKWAHIVVQSGQAKIIGMHVSPYRFSVANGGEKRERKLLLHKKTLLRLEQKTKESGMTLVPTRIYLKNNLIKVSVGLAKGRKDYDKREVLKRRDQERMIAREMWQR